MTRQCPKCDGDMFLCGTFGAVWNCECGHIQEGSEEEQRANDEFWEDFSHRLEKRRPADIERGERLRLLRTTARVTLRDLAQKLGMSSTDVSAWENGFTSISDADVRHYADALYELM